MTEEQPLAPTSPHCSSSPSDASMPRCRAPQQARLVPRADFEAARSQVIRKHHLIPIA